MDCATQPTHIQVRLTRDEIRAIFAAINTAGLLSRGRIKRRSPLDQSLLSAIAKLEDRSGLVQAAEDEWPLD